MWLIYVPVWTRWSLTTEPGSVSYLNPAPLLPRPWQHATPAEPAFSLLGTRAFHSSEAQSTWEASDVCQSTNGSRVFAEWERKSLAS